MIIGKYGEKQGKIREVFWPIHLLTESNDQKILSGFEIHYQLS